MWSKDTLKWLENSVWNFPVSNFRKILSVILKHTDTQTDRWREWHMKRHIGLVDSGYLYSTFDDFFNDTNVLCKFTANQHFLPNRKMSCKHWPCVCEKQQTSKWQAQVPA